VRRVGDLTRPGWAIVVAGLVLVAIGISSIYVTDTHYAGGHDGPRNAAKQCVFALIGAATALAVLRIGYQTIAPFAYYLFGLALLLLVPPLAAKMLDTSFAGLVPPRNGAYRWISLPGFQLQPSEVMKLAYILALAWYLRYRRNYRSFVGLIIPFLVSIVPLTLILLEPDLGTVLLLFPVLFAMLFIAGARISHLSMTILAGLALVPLAWGQIHAYQRLRVTAVLLQSETLRRAVIEHPETYRSLATKRQAQEWAAGSGYQLVHSKNAIGSGGLSGHGWGRGAYVEHDLLPDRHNDFVFAVVAHQWGFLGCLAVVACYAVLAVAGVVVSSSTTEPFGRLLGVGVVTLITAQAVINMGMTMGLMPITGMTLPFVSYGGSSLVTNAMALALLVSVSQHRPYLLSTRPFEFQPLKEAKTPLEDLEKILPGVGAAPR